MKNYFACLALCLLLSMGYGQSSQKGTRLKAIVEHTHKNLRDVATMSGVPYEISANWPEVVYIQRADTLVSVPFDSLANGYNNLDYDVKIVFDKITPIKTQFLQGVIVLEPISEERREKMIKYITEWKSK